MKLIICLLAMSTVFFSCGNSNSATSDVGTTADTTSYPPVETNEPNTDYEPAFEGQTRAPGVKTTTPYEGMIITEALSSPWAVVALPDGRLLVNENEGYMVIVDPETGQISDQITGIPEV